MEQILFKRVQDLNPNRVMKKWQKRPFDMQTLTSESIGNTLDV